MYKEYYRGCTITISQDEHAESPREWDNVGTMACWHRHYKLGDLQPGEQPYAVIHDLAHSAQPLLDEDTERDDYEKLVQCALENHYVILPLYLYDHSGITMSTGAFSCPWDSGQVGIIYCSLVKAQKEFQVTGGWDSVLKDGRTLRAAVTGTLKQEVRVYDQFLRGEVWQYTTEDWDGELIDSCSGFFQDESPDDNDSYVLKQARESIDAYVKNYGAAPVSMEGDHG